MLGSIFARQVTRFGFSRNALGDDEQLAVTQARTLARTMERARCLGAVVVTTGAAVKALLLKVMELMHGSEARLPSPLPALLRLPLPREQVCWQTGVT